MFESREEKLTKFIDTLTQKNKRRISLLIEDTHIVFKGDDARMQKLLPGLMDLVGHENLDIGTREDGDVAVLAKFSEDDIEIIKEYLGLGESDPESDCGYLPPQGWNPPSAP